MGKNEIEKKVDLETVRAIKQRWSKAVRRQFDGVVSIGIVNHANSAQLSIGFRSLKAKKAFTANLKRLSSRSQIAKALRPLTLDLHVAGQPVLHAGVN